MQIEEWVEGAGGFARTRQLLAVGATERMLTSAVRTGRLRRARNGWYSTRPADDPEFQAARLGGMLAGLSALRTLGVWEWVPDRVLRVVVRHGDARLRAPTGRRRPRDPRDRRVRVMWDAELPRRDSRAITVEPLVDALARVVTDEPPEVAAIALDWASAERRIDRIKVESILVRSGTAGRRVARLIDPRSQSVLESVVRIRLRRRGHRVTSQAPLHGGGDIDLLVDGRAAVECDGRRYHADRFVRDREKDLLILSSDLTPVRIGDEQIRRAWPLVLRALDAALVRHGIPSPVGNSGGQRRNRSSRHPKRGSASVAPEFPTGNPSTGVVARGAADPPGSATERSCGTGEHERARGHGE